MSRVPYVVWRKRSWATAIDNTHDRVSADWGLDVAYVVLLDRLHEALPVVREDADAFRATRIARARRESDLIELANFCSCASDEDVAAVLSACTLGGADAALALVRARQAPR